MQNSIHCSSEGRSWTDLISNATFISHGDADDPRPWLKEVPGGAQDVGPFIHELVHHWCFDSVVGAALSTVAHRAMLTAHALVVQRPSNVSPPQMGEDVLADLRAALLAVNGPPQAGMINTEPAALKRSLVGDIVRMEIATAMLRPFAEGLALFAEFDAVSRVSSDAWSPLPVVLSTYFAGMERERQHKLPYPMSTLHTALEVLAAYRLDIGTIDKKSALFTRSLSCAYDGGYLAGYLAVKHMWAHLCTKDPRLTGESDLTMTFLRSHFYDDPVLANLILDTSPVEVGAGAIVDRMQQRIVELEQVHAAHIGTFERHVVESDSPSANAVQERIMAIVTKLHRDDLGWLLGDLSVVLSRRRELTLASVPVTLQRRNPDGEFRVSWAGTWLDDLRAEDWISPPAGDVVEATLEVVGGLSSGRRFLDRAAIVTVAGKPVACRAYGLPDKQAVIRSEMLSVHRTRKDMESSTSVMDWVVEQLIADSPATSAVVEHYRAQLPAIVDDAYRDTALWHATGPAAADHCAELMAEDGLTALLESEDHRRGLALIGLAYSVNPNEAFLRTQFERLSLNLDATLEAVTACRALHGFPPVIRQTASRHYFTVI